jgi:Putative auto-transporter adhesin, head GIN domain
MRLHHLLIPALLAGVAPAAGAEEAVPVPRFDSIQLNGGGIVVLRHGPVQRVVIRSGSTAYTAIRVGPPRARGGDAHRLVIDACNARCPRHYDLRIEIETPRIDAVAVHGGGRITAEAGFPSQRDVAVAVDGGGEIDLRAVAMANVAAAVNGGGSLLVRAEDSLAAAVNGGGAIRYWGSPSVTTSINGGGTVVRGR